MVNLSRRDVSTGDDRYLCRNFFLQCTTLCVVFVGSFNYKSADDVQKGPPRQAPFESDNLRVTFPKQAYVLPRNGRTFIDP